MPTNPDTRYTAPSPYDAPTEQFRLGFDDPAQAGHDAQSQRELMEMFFGPQPADSPESTPDSMPDSEPTPDASPKPYAAYLDSIDLQPLAGEANNLAAVATLHEVLKNVPEPTGDIADVIGKVRQDRTFETTGLPELHMHERILVRLGMSESARQLEWEKLEDADLSKGDDEWGKVRYVREGLQRAISDETDESKKTALQEEDDALDSFLKWNDDANEDEILNLHKTAATTYYERAKRKYPEVDDEVIEASQSVLKLAHINEQEARALRFLSAHIDKLDDATDEEEQEQQTTLEVARATVEEARTAYAAIHASRQKKFFKRKNDEFIEAEEGYRTAVQHMLAAEIEAKVAGSDKFDDEAAINEFIATRTVDEAKLLDEKTIEEYGKTNGKLHKFINFIAGRKEDGEPDPSKLKMFARLSVLGVVGAGLVAGTIASGGALPVAIASGTITTGKLYASFEARGRYNRMHKTPGLLKKEDVIANLQGQRLTIDEDTGEYREMTRGEAAADRMVQSVDMISKAANRETRSQRRHSLKRIGGAIAIGAAVGVGSRLIGHALTGAETAHGAPGDVPPPGDGATPPPPPGGGEITPPTPDTPSVPAPSHEFAPGTFSVQSGEGFYSILKDMGIQASQRDDVLAKAADELFKNGYAYKMPDGLPGIPRTGELAQGAIDILTKAAGK